MSALADTIRILALENYVADCERTMVGAPPGTRLELAREVLAARARMIEIVEGRAA